MGKGDMKTKKGKINRGTFGASRPHKKQNKETKKAAVTVNKSE